MYRYVDTILTLNPEDGGYRACGSKSEPSPNGSTKPAPDAAWLVKFQPPNVNLPRVEAIRDSLK